jgi:hypothetical protein
MFVAPLNYDRFFQKVFSDLKIAKAFLEDFLDVEIESITQLKGKHSVTDDASIVEFDYRCKIDDSYVIIDMQQWYKKDIVKRFYVYHSLSTVLQLENMPSKTVELPPKPNIPSKKVKIKDYRVLEPVITVIWMVDDSLGFTKDYVTQVLTPETLVNFIRSSELWFNKDILALLEKREEVLTELNNTKKELDFLSKNKLTYIFQKNVIKNQKISKYYRWFSFAEKSRNKKNVESDFLEYKDDPVFSEIIRRLSRDLTPEDLAYIQDYDRYIAEIKRYNTELLEEGEKIGIEKGEKIGIEKGEKIGIEKGIEKGKKLAERKAHKEKLKIAINLYKVGLPIDTIVQATGLDKVYLDRFLRNVL